MRFGVLKDIKREEFRVVATPAEIAMIVGDGHEAYVAAGAGCAAGFEDSEYEAAGATIVETNKEIWKLCDFIAKVKEIEPSEFGYLRKGQIIFTCIHPAAHKAEVDALLEAGVVSFAAEDSHRFGSPNCEAAGKVGALMGLWAMMSHNGGSGKFANGLAGAPGVNAIVCGAGTVGRAAIDTLARLGAHVTVMEVNVGKLRNIQQSVGKKIETMVCNKYNLTQMMPKTDLVVNCVRWPKDAKEYMITREMVASMKKGSVIVDISNDYGCIETFHETTHDNPIYVEEGVVHYCVVNMPGAIASSTSVSYAASLLPHFRAIMNKGVAEACVRDGFLRRSLTTYDGYLTHEETSGIQDRPWVKPEVILGIQERHLDVAPPATRTKSDHYYEEFQ